VIVAGRTLCPSWIAEHGGSRLIIYGWKQYAQVLAVLHMMCGRCGNRGEHVLRKLTTKVTLFWIPLFPVNRKHTLFCPACEAEEKVSKEQALAMAAGHPPQPGYGQPAFPGQHQVPPQQIPQQVPQQFRQQYPQPGPQPAFAQSAPRPYPPTGPAQFPPAGPQGFAPQGPQPTRPYPGQPQGGHQAPPPGYPPQQYPPQGYPPHGYPPR
jgi:hypothetical protein